MIVVTSLLFCIAMAHEVPSIDDAEVTEPVEFETAPERIRMRAFRQRALLYEGDKTPSLVSLDDPPLNVTRDGAALSVDELAASSELPDVGEQLNFYYRLRVLSRALLVGPAAAAFLCAGTSLTGAVIGGCLGALVPTGCFSLAVPGACFGLLVGAAFGSTGLGAAGLLASVTWFVIRLFPVVNRHGLVMQAVNHHNLRLADDLDLDPAHLGEGYLPLGDDE